MLRAQARTLQRVGNFFGETDGRPRPSQRGGRPCDGDAEAPVPARPHLPGIGTWPAERARDGGELDERNHLCRSFVRSFVPHTGCAPAVSVSLSLSRSLAHAPPRCSGPATLTRISPLPRSPTPNSHAASLGAITHTQGSIVGAGIYVVIGFTAKDIAGPGIGTRSRCCSCCCSCRCRASFGCTSWPAV